MRDQDEIRDLFEQLQEAYAHLEECRATFLKQAKEHSMISPLRLVLSSRD